MRTFLTLLFLVPALVTVAWTNAPESSEVKYPEGYRRWTHVKSVVSAPEGPTDKRSGIHHIYANDLAMQGYETGKFPEGSIMAFDLLDVTIEGTKTREGKRKLLDVMEKDSKRFAATGGWGFEEFPGDGRVPLLRERAVTACFQCHETRRESDYVFTTFRP